MLSSKVVMIATGKHAVELWTPRYRKSVSIFNAWAASELKFKVKYLTRQVWVSIEAPITLPIRSPLFVATAEWRSLVVYRIDTQQKGYSDKILSRPSFKKYCQFSD
jgi:hypothetical protein